MQVDKGGAKALGFPSFFPSGSHIKETSSWSLQLDAQTKSFLKRDYPYDPENFPRQPSNGKCNAGGLLSQFSR